MIVPIILCVTHVHTNGKGSEVYLFVGGLFGSTLIIIIIINGIIKYTTLRALADE